MRLLAYVRVSTKGQAETGHSLQDDQPARLAAYCQAYGYTLVDVIPDTVSARKVPLHKRPGGAMLLARLAANEADGVIVVKLDRLFRDMRDGFDVLGDALYGSRRGPRRMQVVSLSEHIDTSTEAGRTMLKFQLLMADAEADRTSERTRHAVQGLRERGRVYGTVPYGCVARGGQFDAEQGRVVGQALFREPNAWAMRESIVAMRRELGRSLREIADALRKAGTPAPNGGPRWSKSTLSELIRTHDSLAHLPLLENEGGAGHTAAPDAPASSHSGPSTTRH
jgi:site-specific DNA recombinase